MRARTRNVLLAKRHVPEQRRKMGMMEDNQHPQQGRSGPVGLPSVHPRVALVVSLSERFQVRLRPRHRQVLPGSLLEVPAPALVVQPGDSSLVALLLERQVRAPRRHLARLVLLEPHRLLPRPSEPLAFRLRKLLGYSPWRNHCSLPRRQTRRRCQQQRPRHQRPWLRSPPLPRNLSRERLPRRTRSGLPECSIQSIATRAGMYPIRLLKIY
mmetsp:Transcript_90230/g.135283  ORF Transcript_90230/g.135283 Transcript_90230/m.135283 type:complete len:212 (+) Transcript_90230:1008-1643(+)